MTANLLPLASLVSHTRNSGSTYTSSSGRVCGVDWATTSAITASLGQKTFTIPSESIWKAGDKVYITPADKTANMLMSGTVVSFIGTTLTVDISAVGSNTTTTKTSWRIGYSGPVLDFTSSLLSGLRPEKSRTNLIKNSEGIGGTVGVIGSGGVRPTNWSLVTTNGLTEEYKGFGVEANGLPYVEVRIFGTTTGNTAAYRFAQATECPTLTGELIRHSMWIKVVSGGLNATGYKIRISQRNSGGTNLSQLSKALTLSSVWSKYAGDFVITQATTSFVTGELEINTPAAASFDVTLRIGAVQTEKVRSSAGTGTFQAGGTTSVTLDATASSVNNFYNGLTLKTTGGSGTVGQAAVISAYNGSTKVATISPALSGTDATTTYVIYQYPGESGDAIGSWIPTRTLAETRDSDLIQISSLSSCFTQEKGTIVVDSVSPETSDTYTPAIETVLCLKDSSGDNKIVIGRDPLTSTLSILMYVNPTSNQYGGSVSWPLATRMKVGLCWGPSGIRVCINGGSIQSYSVPSSNYPSGQTIGYVGQDGTAASVFDGWVKSVSISKSEIPDFELIRLTT